MTSDSPASPDSVPPYDASHAVRNRLVISILVVSTFVVILNETIMIVAIPYLMSDLGVTARAAQWLTTAFLLTMAVVIPITGFLMQRINTRPVFILAMLMFSLGTLICAIAPGLELLVFGRVIQASGTAIMMPLLMTTIMMLVPPDNRGKFMGNISIVISVAPALGPAFGGFILSRLEWPWLFWIMLAISLAAMLFGYLRMINVSTTRYAPVDIPSVILSILAFGGIVYGLSSLGQVGGDRGPIPASQVLAIGVISMMLFLWRQLVLQKQDRALLDFRTFASRGFTLSLAMMALAMMVFFGALILLPIYLQKVLGLDTLQTGLVFLPGGLMMGLLAPFVGRLYDRYGPAPLIVPGSIIFSCVLWAMTFLSATTWWGYILMGHILIGTSLALVFTPLFTASLSSIPPQLYAHGSAMLGSIQQLSGAAGVALLVALMAAKSGELAASGIPRAEALAGGITTAFFWGAVISIIAVFTAFFVPRPTVQKGAAEQA